MTCPNCYCAACQAERAKWRTPPVPYSPFIPPHYTQLPPGHWRYACGQTHPPGYTCVSIGKINT
jgi:hypothetical protein